MDDERNLDQQQQEQRVQFADPERSAATTDSYLVQRMKKDFINWLWAGESYKDAAVKALGDERNALKRIQYFREVDQQFDAQVNLQLDLIRKEWLPQLEANMFQQATQDSVAAGNLAFRMAERLDPETWGKPTAEMVVKKPKQAEDYHLSEWFEDPKPLDATYREVDE